MAYRQHGNAEVDPGDPRAFGICDRCGRLWNLWQLKAESQWAGMQLIDTGSLNCPKCWNPPAPFLRQIILPPDPPALRNTRPQNKNDAEISNISTEKTRIIIDTETNLDLIVEVGT